MVARLARAGGEVRAYVDRETTPESVVDGYRRWGVKVARGALDDEALLELALQDAHTVVHTGGGPPDGPAVVLDELASVVSAALGAGCRRVIWPSHLGVGGSGDPYLDACAEGEALLADAPVETVVVRRALTYGPHDPLTALLAARLDGVDGRARHAPLYLDDLAATVQAADAERGGSGPGHLVVELAGPEVVQLADLVEGLADVAPPRVPVRAPGHLAAFLSRHQLPDPAALRAGTSLAEGLARTRSAADSAP